MACPERAKGQEYAVAAIGKPKNVGMENHDCAKLPAVFERSGARCAGWASPTRSVVNAAAATMRDRAAWSWTDAGLTSAQLTSTGSRLATVLVARTGDPSRNRNDNEPPTAAITIVGPTPMSWPAIPPRRAPNGRMP